VYFARQRLSARTSYNRACKMAQRILRNGDKLNDRKSSVFHALFSRNARSERTIRKSCGLSVLPHISTSEPHQGFQLNVIMWNLHYSFVGEFSFGSHRFIIELIFHNLQIDVRRVSENKFIIQ
jgi:hypothetical protein